MASESRTTGADLTASLIGKTLLEEPYLFEFFQAVRLLQEMFPESGHVGTFSQPSNETVRFSTNPSTAFPASQLQQLHWDEATPQRTQLTMDVNFMGLMGALGVLPSPYSALINDRHRASDTTLQDFLDLFNHRMVSLFYRAWSKHQLESKSDADHARSLDTQLLSILGLGTADLQHRYELPDEALLFYSGLLSQFPRSASAQRQILMDYFQVPVKIEQFSGRWYELDSSTQCSFSEMESDSDVLGVGVVVGDAVWSQQYKSTIVLGPMKLERYRDFLPTGSCWKQLRAWCHVFSNQECDFDIKLILDKDSVPRCELGYLDETTSQLGWVSWMRSNPFEQDAEDTVLDIETVFAE